MIDAVKFIEEQKIIAVIRASEYGDAEAIANALIEGGVKILEVTPQIPQAFKLIEIFSKREDVLVGLGSVIDGEQAHRGITSGAGYINSHYTDRNVFTVCRNNEIPVIQGASTVTEIMEAYQLGVDLIKIYPANFLGEAPYVQRLKRSFPFLKLVPAGGVTLENFMDYIKAGAVACVVSRSLSDKSLIRNHQWSEITERAKQFTQKLDFLKVPR